jgi:protein-L-isoaspartate(D-aspartate) O-methyltransferase
MRRLFLVSLGIVVTTVLFSAPPKDKYADLRAQMIAESLVAEGIKNPRVLESMNTVPRHEFVKRDLRPLAYTDQAMEIGEKQTISPPFVVAYMTEVLDPQPEDRVLEIGTGSGYQAAVLSSLVKDVYTIEIVEPLGKRAAVLLKDLGYKNVHPKIGDGYLGWPEHAPFDKIIVTCSPEDVPQPLVDQLKEGGKMIIPLGERYQQVFHLLEKKDGQLATTKLLPTLFVPMTGKSEDLREVKPNPAEPRIVNGGFEETADDNAAVGWHYQRRTKVSDDAPATGKKYMRFESNEVGKSAHILQGMGIDGSQVAEIDIRMNLKIEKVRPGMGQNEKPGFILHFFDGKRLPIGNGVIGPWLADETTWHEIGRKIAVPKQAREAILQVGLNGAGGVMSLDDLRMTVTKRPEK